MPAKIGLVDYGMGNLHSVESAFKRLNKPIRHVRSPRDLNKCNALVLPGVGAFDPAMENLRSTELIPYLKDWANQKKPLLGICLGLQLLFESSEEGDLEGLGILKGHVRRLPSNQGERIPHMGWAPLLSRHACPLLPVNSKENWMYFVHSFSAIPLNDLDLAATAKFGNTNVTAIVWKGTIGACQFHPEKSSEAGKKMLLRWINWLENLQTDQK